MKTKIFLLCIALLSSVAGKAQLSLPFIKKTEKPIVTEKDYSVDDQNNIVVTRIVENLNGKQSDIYTLAKEYLTEAYEETIYEIIKEDIENGTIIGKGTYSKFVKMNIFPNTFYLNAVFQAKIDSKDGRVRISLYAREYSGQRINGNNVEELADKICDFQPINPKNSEKKKLYNKAFPILIERMKATIAKIEKTLKSGIPSIQNDNW